MVTKATKKTPAKASKTGAKKVAKKKVAKKTAKKTEKKPAPAKPSVWTPASLMAELKRLGTEQNRKVYARHGAPASMYGVSFANLYALQKQIKRNHDLARALWQSGNSDAQTLGALIADPDRATRAELESWAKSASWFMCVDYLAGFVARTPHALPLVKKWTGAKPELLKRAGYSTLGSLIKNGAHDGQPLDTALIAAHLAAIEREIHTAPNRAREAMNSCLITIGIYCEPLHKGAIAAAKRIGKVEIEHAKGTNCKDFIATDEIAKGRAHRAKEAKVSR